MLHLRRGLVRAVVPTARAISTHRPRSFPPNNFAIELAIPTASSSTSRRFMTPLQLLVLVMPVGTITSLNSSSIAECAGKKDENDHTTDLFDWDKIQTTIDHALEQLPTSWNHVQTHVQSHVENWASKGQLQNISWGFALGACSGYSLKKVSKVGAFLVGIAFCATQVASYNGYVDVNYEKLQEDITKLMDINKDGAVNAKDAKALYDKAMGILEYSLPAGSGFGVGFLVGFRAA
ncbi:Aste57867_2080 [Aphanomyces stellatus]|uniref:Aste57867_2080 protein n=1 Tax=Aphanomyces stellatus TaxID=120398 RepID=A0A485K6N0_9STRA|nr:hypothetical protein As57867_002076 [Aphanomyces stellatus]VFT79283.1 Aste57867_2080 [Aphanomyces stellatus]